MPRKKSSRTKSVGRPRKETVETTDVTIAEVSAKEARSDDTSVNITKRKWVPGKVIYESRSRYCSGRSARRIFRLMIALWFVASAMERLFVTFSEWFIQANGFILLHVSPASPIIPVFKLFLYALLIVEAVGAAFLALGREGLGFDLLTVYLLATILLQIILVLLSRRAVQFYNLAHTKIMSHF